MSPNDEQFLGYLSPNDEQFCGILVQVIIQVRLIQ